MARVRDSGVEYESAPNITVEVAIPEEAPNTTEEAPNPNTTEEADDGDGDEEIPEERHSNDGDGDGSGGEVEKVCIFNIENANYLILKMRWGFPMHAMRMRDGVFQCMR